MPNDTTSKQISRRELEEKIIARAWRDDEFRANFLADPKRMFEQHLGTRLAESLQMTAHQETENSIHFVIPAKPRAKLDELSDEDLEKVAGGIDAVSTVVLTAIIVGTVVATATAGTVASAIVTKDEGWTQ